MEPIMSVLKNKQWRDIMPVLHIDHQIGRLLMALEEDGSLEDTLIVFLSDHGNCCLIIICIVKFSLSRQCSCPTNI